MRSSRDLRSDNGRYQQSADEVDYYSLSRLYLVRKLPNRLKFAFYWCYLLDLLFY